MTKCPNCHASINSQSTNTGNMQMNMPDPKKPKTAPVGKNVLLNEVIFDSRTKRFIIADSFTDAPQPSTMHRRDNRKRFFPKMKDLPRAVDDNMESREFKEMINPYSTNQNKKVDDVSKSCTDLAIDG